MMDVGLSSLRHGVATIAAGWLLLFHLTSVAVELPQPLTLSAAMEHIAESLPAEHIASEYQETAIHARVFECRAQESITAAIHPESRGCGYWHLLSPRQQTHLDVMRRFLDVVEADLAAAVDEEAMAVAFVQLDRARNREELGQYSPLAASELELEYQRIRSRRYLGQALQRATRARLLTAMGRSGPLPSDVQAPEMAPLPDQIVDLEKITEEALTGNPVVAEWKKRAAVDTSLQPLVDELVVHLRDAVLDLWLFYPVVLAEIEMDRARDRYRDLDLDRSRTLYELEAKADLGDAMTQQTAARLARTRSEHRASMVLASLNALRGMPFDHAIAKESTQQ